MMQRKFCYRSDGWEVGIEDDGSLSGSVALRQRRYESVMLIESDDRPLIEPKDQRENKRKYPVGDSMSDEGSECVLRLRIGERRGWTPVAISQIDMRDFHPTCSDIEAESKIGNDDIRPYFFDQSLIGLDVATEFTVSVEGVDGKSEAAGESLIGNGWQGMPVEPGLLDELSVARPAGEDDAESRIIKEWCC